MLGRSLQKTRETAAPSRPTTDSAPRVSETAQAKPSQKDVASPEDPALTQRFRQACVQSILQWCDRYLTVLQDLNKDKVPPGAPVLIEEVYFRAALAINTQLAGFFMGREVSLIQNSVAVVASMMRGRIHEAEPSLQSYLESAHDMLRRLDPTLWTSFDEVVRYVLPLRVRCLSGWEYVPEVANILERARRTVDSRDIFPLSHEQVGYIKDLLYQEETESAQRYIVKLVNNACTTRNLDSRAYPIRLQMSRAAFHARLDAMSPLEILSVMLGFHLAGIMDDSFIPRPKDERMQVNSLHFLLGEGCLFPLNSQPLVEIQPQLIQQQLARVAGARPSKMPLVYYPDSKTMFKRSEDGSLSQGLSSSGDDISQLIGISVARPATSARRQGYEREDFARQMQRGQVYTTRPAFVRK